MAGFKQQIVIYLFIYLFIYYFFGGCFLSFGRIIERRDEAGVVGSAILTRIKRVRRGSGRPPLDRIHLSHWIRSGVPVRTELAVKLFCPMKKSFRISFWSRSVKGCGCEKRKGVRDCAAKSTFKPPLFFSQHRGKLTPYRPPRFSVAS